MKRCGLTVLTSIFCALATPARAHPVPFTYLDLRIQSGVLELTLIAHDFDVAHDLGMDPSDRLLDPAVVRERSDAIIALLAPRLQVLTDGTPLANPTWMPVEALPDRKSVRLGARYSVAQGTGVFAVETHFFPYDPVHQTFVNVYEGDTLTLQAILDRERPRLEYFAGSRQGTFAVVRRFLPAGLRHIFATPEHWTFVVGLLLLGGSARRLGLIAAGFVVGHLAALVLVTSGLLRPPARIVDPAIALSIIYVGADNLMVRGGRDMRAWIAVAFGLIHGFWFAGALANANLPRLAFVWSLFAFNVGADIAQVTIVVVAGFAVKWLHDRHKLAARRLVYIGSVVAIAAGAYWFIQRVFFPGGIV
jgi:hypothetical protein